MVTTQTAALVAEIERLTKELAEVKQDAERYRWLKQDRSPLNGAPFICRNNEGMFSRWVGGHADNAIDAAMRRTDAGAKIQTTL